MLAKQVLPEISWNRESRWVIAEWIGTVLELGPRKSMVNYSLVEPGLGTASARLAQRAEGFL